MTDGVNFSGKMAKEINLADIKAKVNDVELSADKKTVLGGIFDTDSNSKISTEELAESLDKIDLNRDGKLTDDEMGAAYEKLTAEQKQNVAKNEYIAYLKAMSAQNTELVKDKSNVGNAYVVQLGEQFDDLIIRAMKSNGVAEDKCKAGTEEFNAYVARFKQDNAGAFATNDDGSVKWLYAGTKVYLNTDTTGSDKGVQNQDNKAQAENDYREWVSGGKKGFVYQVDPATGKRYKVSGSTKTEITTGSEDASPQGGSSGVTNVISADAVKENVLLGKITERSCKAQGFDDVNKVKDIAQKGLDVLSSLANDESIEKIEDKGNYSGTEQSVGYVIKLKDGSEVDINCDVSGPIDTFNIYFEDSENSYSISFSSADDSLSVSITPSNSEDGIEPVVLNFDGAVKDFDAILQFVQNSPKVREAMDLPSKNFVDMDAILQEEMPEGVNVSDVKSQIQNTNAVITNLENPSMIKKINTNSNTGTVTITMVDNIVIKLERNADSELCKVTIGDVTYDMSGENRDISVKINGKIVKSNGVIKNYEALLQFIESAVDKASSQGS